MAKGQKCSNREIRKPKKKKEAATTPGVLGEGLPTSTSIPKRKG